LSDNLPDTQASNLAEGVVVNLMMVVVMMVLLVPVR